VPGEYVQDQGRSIQNFDVETLLQLALLARTQFIVKQEDIDGQFVTIGLQFVNLAAADQGIGLDRCQTLVGATCDVQASSIGQGS
jgi:hypothetical protein